MAARRPLLRRATLALAIALALTSLPATARAEQESLAYQGLVGFGATLCTLVYGPLKVAYAVGGIPVTTLAWLWTWDPEVAGPIFRMSVGGDYVVTPSHLEGRRSLHFVGPRH